MNILPFSLIFLAGLLILFYGSLLGSLLLLLLALSFRASGPSQGPLKNLQDFFVRNLLIRLKFGQVRAWRSRQPDQAVLDNG